MPDWTGLWQRVGAPFFDPAQKREQLTTARLKRSRSRSSSTAASSPRRVSSTIDQRLRPAGVSALLAIPFLREFIVTPTQTYLFSETVNNLRRVYTDGREHPPAADAIRCTTGDSIGSGRVRRS